MKNVFAWCNALIVILLCVGPTFAAFDDMGIGARPLGMGGAFVAIADDANGAMHNPAGLGYISGAAAGFTHVRMFSNVVNYSHVSIVLPLSIAGTFGASFGMLGEESNIYSEKSVMFSYSRKAIEALSLGVNLKMLNTSFEVDKATNQYFAKTSASAFTADLGVLTRPVAGLSIGLSGENLIPADVSISKEGEENVSTNLKAGLAYKLSAISSSVQQPALKEVLNTAIISVEGAMRKEREANAVRVRAGIEAWFANRTVALRAGYRMKKVQEVSSSATIGGSIRIPITDVNLQLDYALQIFGGEIENKFAHRVSLAVSL